MLVHGNEGVIVLIDDLSISDAVLCGYDIGSFTEQTIAVKRPDLAHSLVIAAPTQGVGRQSASANMCEKPRNNPNRPGRVDLVHLPRAAASPLVAQLLRMRRDSAVVVSGCGR